MKTLAIITALVLSGCNANYLQTEVDCDNPVPMWNVRGPVIEQYHTWQVEALCGKGNAACLFMQPSGFYQMVVLAGDYEALKHEFEHASCGAEHKGAK